jgi:hypothetical protein
VRYVRGTTEQRLLAVEEKPRTQQLLAVDTAVVNKPGTQRLLAVNTATVDSRLGSNNLLAPPLRLKTPYEDYWTLP